MCIGKDPPRGGGVPHGGTAAAMHEALDLLDGQGLHLDALRVRAFPFGDEVIEFVERHDTVFVVEQNRDAQLRTLLVNEGAFDPAKLMPVLHYDGTPVTARFIAGAIADKLAALISRGEEIVPALKNHEVTAIYAGLRPATERKDYCITAHEGLSCITVGGIRSTGLSGALGIAQHVERLAALARAPTANPR